MEKTLTTRQFVKKICEELPDESIIATIQDWKTKPFVGLFDNGDTWFSISKKYFETYLKQFNRNNISL